MIESGYDGGALLGYIQPDGSIAVCVLLRGGDPRVEGQALTTVFASEPYARALCANEAVPSLREAAKSLGVMPAATGSPQATYWSLTDFGRGAVRDLGMPAYLWSPIGAWHVATTLDKTKRPMWKTIKKSPEPPSWYGKETTEASKDPLGSVVLEIL